VKVFTVRNVSDIRRNDIFRGKFGKKFHGCPIKVYVREFPRFVNRPKPFYYNDIDLGIYTKMNGKLKC